MTTNSEEYSFSRGGGGGGGGGGHGGGGGRSGGGGGGRHGGGGGRWNGGGGRWNGGGGCGGGGCGGGWNNWGNWGGVGDYYGGGYYANPYPYYYYPYAYYFTNPYPVVSPYFYNNNPEYFFGDGPKAQINVEQQNWNVRDQNPYERNYVTNTDPNKDGSAKHGFIKVSGCYKQNQSEEPYDQNIYGQYNDYFFSSPENSNRTDNINIISEVPFVQNITNFDQYKSNNSIDNNIPNVSGIPLEESFDYLNPSTHYYPQTERTNFLNRQQFITPTDAIITSPILQVTEEQQRITKPRPGPIVSGARMSESPLVTMVDEYGNRKIASKLFYEDNNNGSFMSRNPNKTCNQSNKMNMQEYSKLSALDAYSGLNYPCPVPYAIKPK